MEFIQKGNQLFVEENYDEACVQYTKAIAKLMGKAQFSALFGRGRALMYLDKHSNAVRDFGECISLNYQHQLTNYYLGICLMRVGKNDIEKAKKAHKYLLIAQKGSSKQDRFEKAVNKCIKLLQKLQPKIEIKSQPEQKKQTPEKTKNEETVKTENNNEDIEMKDNTQKTDKSETNTTTKSQTEASKPKQATIRDSWYQSASSITFTLYAKNLTRQDVSISYFESKVVIQLKLKDGTIYQRNVSLRHKIVADKCSFTMNKYKIIITLVKLTSGDWDELEHKIDDGKHHSMISAPWTTKKDWSSVDKFATKELEKEKPEGDDALQQLFSKIYTDADDDQRRAMVKSFQTSGGTVLSTNWKDVKNKDYEGKDKVLPTGQNVKKYEY